MDIIDRGEAGLLAVPVSDQPKLLIEAAHTALTRSVVEGKRDLSQAEVDILADFLRQAIECEIVGIAIRTPEDLVPLAGALLTTNMDRTNEDGADGLKLAAEILNLHDKFIEPIRTAAEALTPDAIINPVTAADVPQAQSPPPFTHRYRNSWA